MYLALEAVLDQGKLVKVIGVLNDRAYRLMPEPVINWVCGPIEFVGRMPIRTDVEIKWPA